MFNIIKVVTWVKNLNWFCKRGFKSELLRVPVHLWSNIIVCDMLCKTSMKTQISNTCIMLGTINIDNLSVISA